MAWRTAYISMGATPRGSRRTQCNSLRGKAASWFRTRPPHTKNLRALMASKSLRLWANRHTVAIDENHLIPCHIFHGWHKRSPTLTAHVTNISQRLSPQLRLWTLVSTNKNKCNIPLPDAETSLLKMHQRLICLTFWSAFRETWSFINDSILKWSSSFISNNLK